MKLSPQQVDDLLTFVEHGRRDLSWKESGSYSCLDEKGNWPFDNKSAKKAERAIELIKKIILERE